MVLGSNVYKAVQALWTFTQGTGEVASAIDTGLGATTQATGVAQASGAAATEIGVTAAGDAASAYLKDSVRGQKQVNFGKDPRTSTSFGSADDPLAAIIEGKIDNLVDDFHQNQEDQLGTSQAKRPRLSSSHNIQESSRVTQNQALPHKERTHLKPKRKRVTDLTDLVNKRARIEAGFRGIKRKALLDEALLNSAKRYRVQEQSSLPGVRHSSYIAQRITNMVFTRRRARRTSRAFKAKRGYYRKAGNYGRFATTRGAGRKRTQYPEMKYFDQTGSLTEDATSKGIIVESNLTKIPQGVNASERVGRKISVKKLQIRAKLSLIGAVASGVGVGATYFDRARVILYIDRQTNGVAASVLELLQAVSGGAGPPTAPFTDNSINDLQNLPNSARFWILKDKIYPLNSGGSSGLNNMGVVRTFDCNYNFKKGLPIVWDTSNTDGSIGTMRSNSIKMLILTDADRSGTTFGVQMTYNWRVRYYD